MLPVAVIKACAEFFSSLKSFLLFIFTLRTIDNSFLCYLIVVARTWYLRFSRHVFTDDDFVVVSFFLIILSLRSGIDVNSDPGPGETRSERTLARATDRETPPSCRRGYSVYILSSDLVELCH